MILEFKEPETFTTPDGNTYIINPLPTRAMKTIFKFIELNNQQQEYIKNGEKDKVNELVYGPLVELVEEIVDKSVKNVENGEPLSEKYRTLGKLIEICNQVVISTVDANPEMAKQMEEEAGGNPLEALEASSTK